MDSGSLTDRFYGLIKSYHAAAKAKEANYPEVDILSIWKRFLKELSITAPSMKVLQEMAIRFECAVNPGWPRPILKDFLKNLKGRSKPMGIVSNAQFYTPIKLEAFTGTTLGDLEFDNYLCFCSFQKHLEKPSVELFEKLTEALGRRCIAAGQALYLSNDLLNYIWTANDVGLQAVSFAGDERSLRLCKSNDRCADLSADTVVTALIQIETLIWFDRITATSNLLPWLHPV